MKKLFFSFFGGDVRSIVARALALRPRGAVLKDGLELIACTGQLKIEWCARGIHPWDLDLAPNRQAELFLQQAMEDTEAAILRLFHNLPNEIDTIEIRVFDPADRQKLVVAGIINREDVLSANTSQSLRMRLKMLGIH